MTQQAQHTPGPWYAAHYSQSSRRRLSVQGHNFREVAEIIPTTMKAYDAEAEANSRLIAAAPELLEALIECAEHLDDMTHDAGDFGEEERHGFKNYPKSHPTVERARAAIAKVRGQA